jgi:[acyl-carrier-protein] S-malonyltransferase
MGLELAAHDSRAATLLEFAGQCGGFSAAKVLRRGGEPLSDTRILQPLMTAVTLGMSEALARAGLRPQLATGHSLGELAACSALGGIGSEAAIELAAARGQLLSETAHAQAGAMLALPKLDHAGLDAALAIGRSHGVVDVGLHNAPGRWVLSGHRRALSRVSERVGGSFIATGGAWHSRLMSPAAAKFRARLDARADLVATPGLALNQDGRLLGERGRAELVRALVEQLTSTVRFAGAITELVSPMDTQRPDLDVIVVGPSKVVRALIRRSFDVRADHELLFRLHGAERPADIDAILATMQGCERRRASA